MWELSLAWLLGVAMGIVGVAFFDFRAIDRVIRYAEGLEKRVLELERDPGSWKP